MAILELKKPRGTSGNSRQRQAVEDSDGELEIEISGGAFAAVFKKSRVLKLTDEKLSLVLLTDSL